MPAAILTHTLITAIVAREIPCPPDMRAEMARDTAFWRGGDLWTFDTRTGTGTALRAPSGDGAIEHGGDSVWGTWTDGPDGWIFTANDARNEDGSPVRYDEWGAPL